MLLNKEVMHFCFLRRKEKQINNSILYQNTFYVSEAYAPSSTPGFSGNTRVGYVVMYIACTSFYASISTTSCLANQIGLISGLVHFALCTRPTRRVLRDGCLANQNVWMEDTCSCKKNVRSVRAQPACCHTSNDAKCSVI